MKKIALAFVLMLFLSNIFVFDVVHVVQEWRAEEEAEEEIQRDPSKSTTFVVANLNSIDWERTGKEFEKDGELYDVISITPSTIGYQIVAWCDDNEKEVEDNYQAFNSEKQESNSSNPSFTSSIQVLPFLVPTFEYVLKFYSDVHISYHPFLAKAIQPAEIGLFFPPPEFC